MNNKDNMPPPETKPLLLIGPEKCNLTETQYRGFKILFVYIKEGMNKCLNGDHGNTLE